MNYETWVTLNNVGIIGVLVVPIVFAVAVFLRQRRPRSPDGPVTGRPVVWALATLVGSFIVLVVAWGVLLQERYPAYVARHDAEFAASEGSGNVSSSSSPGVIDGVVGSWRPNNPNRSDHFTFTANTYAAVNPETNTVITYRYRVLRQDGPCMRIQDTGHEVTQGGSETERSSRSGQAFIVCVDPETDQMLMRFDGDRGDVFFSRMN